MNTTLRPLLPVVGILEPYFGGSHKAFIEALMRWSDLRYEVFTMPPRKWKWRMRGSALYYQQKLPRILACDVLLASGFINLAEFVGLSRKNAPQHSLPPLFLFMHENQLTYPVQEEDERDYQYGFINILSCLTADHVSFNSSFHQESFLAAIPAFLNRMPDFIPPGVAEIIRAKSSVAYLGVEVPDFFSATPSIQKREVATTSKSSVPLRIGWNHRWEFDKCPEAFFEALFALHDAGEAFELVVLGERFRECPEIFAQARMRLATHIIHWGFATSRDEYFRLLGSCHLVVSTAIHEFFGLAVLEAGRSGCGLLLPNRLSYPELIPVELHGQVLYDTPHVLLARLYDYARNPESARLLGTKLQLKLSTFCWKQRIALFDSILSRLVHAHGKLEMPEE